jgi:hypothetical protein
MAIVAGCAAGVLGYTGLWGLAVFFLTNAIVSAALFAKAGMDASYFGGRSQLVSGGIMGGFGVLPPPAAPRLFLSPKWRASEPRCACERAPLRPTCCADFIDKVTLSIKLTIARP